jgi:hypothetical protein
MSNTKKSFEMNPNIECFAICGSDIEFNLSSASVVRARA